jgi:hypothetical protein
VVALDDAGKPVKVTPLILSTEDDRRRFLEGESRMNARLK